MATARWVVGLLLVAAAVRLVFWLDARDLSLVQQPTGDAATYVYLSNELDRDGVLAPLGQPYHRAPLYPFFLWAVTSLGWGLTGVRLIQFAMGLAGVVLLWSVGKRLAGTTGAVVAGIGAALYGPFIFFESDLLSISLAVFLLEVALVLWGRTRWAVAVGLLIGAAALAQPNFLLAGLIAAAASVLRPRTLGWASRSAALLLVAGLLIPPAITFTRNLAVSGEPVLISTNGGVNFYIGNNPKGDGTFHLPPESGLLNRPEGLFTSARAVAEEQTSRSLTDAGVDRYWWLRGVDFWLTDPGRALGVTLGKVLLSVNDDELPSHYDYGFFRERVRILRVLPTMGWLLPLGGLGLVIALRRRRYFVVLLFLAFLASIVPFFITARYRLPLAVLLLPAAGLAVEWVWARRRSLRQLAWPAVGILAYLSLALLPLKSGGEAHAHMLNIEGAAEFSRGDVDAARRTFERALEIDPNHPEVLNNLASIYEQQGQLKEALALYRRALISNPTQAETYFNLEELYRKAGRNEEALEALARLEAARSGRVEDVAGTMAYRRAVNTLTLGDTTRAHELLQEAVASQPDLAGAWLSLSILSRKMGLDEESVTAAERAAALAPRSIEALANQGKALEDAGRGEDAIVAYQRAVEAGAADRDLRYRLGRLLVAAGRLEEGEVMLLQANEGQPHHEALWELGQLYERQGRTEDALTAYQALIRVGSFYAGKAKGRIRELGGSRR